MLAQVKTGYVDLTVRLYWQIWPDAPAYFRLLDRIHRQLRPRTYLEVGVATGASMTLSLPGTRNLGIDPDPRISLPVPPSTTIFAETSDHFFATHDLRELLGGLPLDLAFIDGMHHFEFALRDFINLERRASPGTTILVHDCYPVDEESASRVRTTEVWSGDVWKLIVCLREQRPDLSVSVVDVGPTGLGIITGLDPQNRVLEALDEEEYRALPYRRLAEDKQATLNRVPDDWETVRALLPATPFRSDSLPLAVTRRWSRAAMPVARRSVRRAAARTRRRLLRVAA